MGEKLNKIKYVLKVKLWIFILYLITEPFRQMWLYIKELVASTNQYSNPKPWIPILILITVVFLLVGNRPMTYFFLFLVVLTILKYEWDRGDYMARHRQKKAEEGLKK